MRVYLNKNVLEAAIERIKWIFDEFPNVCVNISGGKDSTVVLNLALQEAERRGRLPLPVMFLDQEAEWQCVIDYIKSVMYDERVKPYWLQIPFILTNATSVDEPYLWCWKDGVEPLREKDMISIKENRYGRIRFHDIFEAFLAKEFAGVRAEESPGRQLGLTSTLKYKHVTWGRKYKYPNHFAFYPIYDWSYTDVWKAIHEHKWPYTRLYDYQYQHGLPISQMRVSSVHHETSLYSLLYMREIEPETWDKMLKRLRGVNSVKHFGWSYFCPDELPFMFNSWREYRDYLLEKMITDEDMRERLRRAIKRDDETYVEEVHESMIKRHINSILVKDIDLTRIGTWRAAHLNFRRRTREPEHVGQNTFTN